MSQRLGLRSSVSRVETQKLKLKISTGQWTLKIKWASWSQSHRPALYIHLLHEVIKTIKGNVIISLWVRVALNLYLCLLIFVFLSLIRQKFGGDPFHVNPLKPSKMNQKSSTIYHPEIYLAHLKFLFLFIS